MLIRLPLELHNVLENLDNLGDLKALLLNSRGSYALRRTFPSSLLLENGIRAETDRVFSREHSQSATLATQKLVASIGNSIRFFELVF